jgi:diacylglycerol O-acyltransferase
MERLGVQDSSFFDSEAGGPPMAVGGVLRIQGVVSPIEDFRAEIFDRLGGMERLRQRVVPSRGIRQPKWVEVEPDPTRHVNNLVVSAGTSVEDAVASIIELPMDHAYPLWDCHLISGYSETEYAICMRVHHSIADGQGTILLLGHLLDLSPEGGMTLTDAVTAMLEGEKPPDEVSSAPLFMRVAQTTAARLEPAIAALSEFTRTFPDTAQTLAAFTPKKPRERLGITGQVRAERVWVSDQFPLDRVKAAKRHFDCTVNDIVLAACASGFRDLLLERGDDLPQDRILRVAMPVSLRPSGDQSSSNQVQMLPIGLPTGIGDSEQRLNVIKTVTTSVKRSKLPVISDAVWTMAEKATPSPVMSLVLAKSVANMDWYFETVITNIPGPPMPLFVMGSQVLSLIPLVPLASGSRMQILISILSYNGHLGFGITGDATGAGDVDVLLAGILNELGTLADFAE